MVKRQKCILFLVLCLGIILSLLGFTLCDNHVAKADTNSVPIQNMNTHSDGRFRFVSPELSETLSVSSPTIEFNVSLDNTSLNGQVNDLDNTVKKAACRQTYETQGIFKFSVYLADSDQTATLIKTYAFLCYGNKVDVYEKKVSSVSNAELFYSHFLEHYSKCTYVSNHEFESNVFDWVQNDELQGYSFKGSYTVPYWGLKFTQGNSGAFNTLVLRNIVPDSRYIVGVSYEVYTQCWYNFFGNPCNDGPVYSGEVFSTRVGVMSIIHQIQSDGTIETYSNSFQSAYEAFLLNYDGKDVVLNYLVPIEGTPFARRQTWTGRMICYDGQITVGDALKLINVPTLICNYSSIEYFVKDTERSTESMYYFNAFYRDAVALNGIDVNGNTCEYILDLNHSYMDYFSPFVDSGVFTESMYRFLYNRIIQDYGIVEGVAEEDLYGYFGMVMIPSSVSLNRVWKDMFDVDTTYSGIIQPYQYDHTVSLEYYNNLKRDYDYGWLYRMWEDLASTLTGDTTVTFYAFFVDCTVSTNLCDDVLFIGENAAEDAYDNSGVIANNMTDIVSGIVLAGCDTALPVFAILMLVLLIGLVVLVFVKIIRFLFPKKGKGD